MKQAIAIILTTVLVVAMFTSCGKILIYDKEGNSHVAVTQRGGDFKQDENGNMIEQYTNDDGEKVTAAISFPSVTKRGRRTIENAFFKVKFPKDWKFDDSIRSFRIQHEGKCAESGELCQISTDSSKTGDVKQFYNNKYANEVIIQDSQIGLIKEIKEFDTTLFGIDTKAYSVSYETTGAVKYDYFFLHANNVIQIEFLVNDKCKDEINPEQFIEENFVLKNVG